MTEGESKVVRIVHHYDNRERPDTLHVDDLVKTEIIVDGEVTWSREGPESKAWGLGFALGCRFRRDDVEIHSEHCGGCRREAL